MSWPHVRRFLKTSCAVFTVTLFVYCLSPLPSEFDINDRRTIMIEDGVIKLILWAGPRATTQHDCYGPDCIGCPLWFIFTWLVVFTVFFWQLDRPDFISKRVGEKGLSKKAQCLLWGLLCLIAGVISLFLWIAEMTGGMHFMLFPFLLLWFGMVAVCLGLGLMFYSVITFKPPMRAN